MFIGYKLSPQSRQALLERFPPKYSRVICDHITEAFGVKSDTPLPEDPKHVEVIGYADSEDGIECLTCKVNEATMRPDGKLYHITLSLNQDRRPVESNDFTDTAEIIDPISLTDCKVYTE